MPYLISKIYVQNPINYKSWITCYSIFCFKSFNKSMPWEKNQFPAQRLESIEYRKMRCRVLWFFNIICNRQTRKYKMSLKHNAMQCIDAIASIFVLCNCRYTSCKKTYLLNGNMLAKVMVQNCFYYIIYVHNNVLFQIFYWNLHIKLLFHVNIDILIKKTFCYNSRDFLYNFRPSRLHLFL